ncbi:MAG: hypothetical protein KJ069_06300 [Anaerolineae bacterium]|nr:hypothetical protein [Anaerolineae bacterium]
MWNLYRAELQKTVGNKWVTGFLLWIFPVGALGVLVFVSLLALAMENFAQNFFAEPPLWTDTVIAVWGFPTNTLVQMLLLGLTAVTFAGEYQWGTWKNILPRHRRPALIGVKFLTLGTLVVFSFVLMSIIVGLGFAVLTRIADVPYGPAISAAVLRQFTGDYALNAALAFITVLITAVYAAFAAMLMRSMVGGIVVGLGFVIIEPVTAFLFMPLAAWLEWDWLLHIFRFTPTYNVNNISSWVRFDTPTNLSHFFFEMRNLTPPVDSVTFSLTVLAVWLVVGIGLILVLFKRQDITG